MLRGIIYAVSVVAIQLGTAGMAFSQNPLFIPDTLSGKVFNLTVQKGTKQFFTGINTPTFGYNGNILGPTLLINKNDSITLNVINTIGTSTTVHWHGFHIAPEFDGGPHQIINNNSTWSPSFRMLNNAGTYWYHPHGENKTEIQVSRGLAGMIIVRDKTEPFALPRRYGVDDFPLILQTKAFDVLSQIATANHEDTLVMVNATVNPFLSVPKQVVRLRLLNGSSDRTFYVGLGDNRPFYIIATDGGLLSEPYQTNRIRISTGERVEILVDFKNDSLGKQIYLKSFASELPRGIIGADSVGTSSIIIGEGYYSNPLNGADFNLLRFDIGPASGNPVTSIPAKFNNLNLFDTSNIDAYRHIHFSADTADFGDQSKVDGPFKMNGKSFHMDSVNIITYLGNKEIWTLTNSTMVAHPFHIHDIQFNILDINGVNPTPEYSGWKDVMLVKPGDTVRFVTQFTNFSNKTVPYMFHCHLLHHEDEGMMGSFLVLDTNATGIKNPSINNSIHIYPNPSSQKWIITSMIPTKGMQAEVYDAFGRLITSGSINFESAVLEIDNTSYKPGIYLLRLQNQDTFTTYKLIKN